MIAAINRLYRSVFCRGGHGVHSPFVFDLITTVIEERSSYYCYDSLSTVRKQLQQNMHKFCFTEREDRLLFRLANRFKPRTIYMMGSDLGLAPLYLTAYSKHARCVVVEPDKLDIIDNNIDLIVWGRSFSGASGGRGNVHEVFNEETFEKFLPYINDESVMVISGINASRKSTETWKRICASPRVTVTLDLYTLGIVFFNPKLHRKMYKSLVL